MFSHYMQQVDHNHNIEKALEHSRLQKELASLPRSGFFSRIFNSFKRTQKQDLPAYQACTPALSHK